MKRLLSILLLVLSVGVWAETIKLDGGTYTGDVLKGVPNGQGTWSIPRVQVSSQSGYIDGRTYVGQWTNGKYDGQGTLETSPTKYVGQSKDGMRHGVRFE